MTGADPGSGYRLHVSEGQVARQTAPVLAVMVCHDGEAWLPSVLRAVQRSSVRPARIVAVDTGSADRTKELLTEAAESSIATIDAVVTVPRESGFAAAIAAGVRLADETFDDEVRWLWLLHDDSAPEPDCLAALLNAAEAAPSAAVLGPLGVDWSDPRLVVEAGLSTDATGRRRLDSGLTTSGTPLEGPTEQSNEVLAVPSAGALVDRSLWDSLGGFDESFALLGEDLDFGWRANAVGRTVLSVPQARIRHARALHAGERDTAALESTDPAALRIAERRAGVRTFLLNCSRLSFLVGVPRLAVLCFLRGLGLLLTGRASLARAEFAAAGLVLRGLSRLRKARAERTAEWRRLGPDGKRSSVRGLVVGRFARMRLAIRRGVLALVRRNVAREVALGRVPEMTAVRATWTPPEELRAAAFGGRTRGVVAVPLAEREAPPPPLATTERSTEVEDRPRPSPGAHAGSGGLVFVEVDRKRILAATLLAPGLLLTVATVALALAVNWQRLSLDLTGGRLLPVGSLGEMWSSYLTGWHPVGGGTSAHAPAALAVLGTLGAPFVLVGGPAALVALLLLFDIPLAALSAYAATRRLRVRRWVRALLAGAYALLPPATAAVAQGRVDVVVAHIVLPLVVAGIGAVLRPEAMAKLDARDGRRWLSTAGSTALGVAVIGAFSPLTHVAIVVGLLVAFVVTPSTVRLSRRVAGLAVVALLPVALLLPWPIEWVRNPALLLHGVGARVGEVSVSDGELFSLHPGGVGAVPLGAMLIIAALVGLIIRPRVSAVVGGGIVVLGGAALAAVLLLPMAPAIGGEARTGWAGAPLLIIGFGLLCVLVSVTQYETGAHVRRSPFGVAHRLAVAVSVGGLVVLAVGAVVAGREGPLRPADQVQPTAAIAAELRRSGTAILELRADDDPPRMVAGRTARFGDDDLRLPAGAADRLAGWQQVLLAPPDPEAVRATMASAGAAGVRFVALPAGVPADRVLAAAGEVATPAPALADGRQLIRLRPPSGPVTLIAPEVTKLAVNGEPPTGDIEGEGVAVVETSPPDVRVRVSDGPGGRLLVLAATHEAGWHATVNGKRQPIVRAWGHQVAVEVPTRAAEVEVTYDSTVREILLLAQIGAVLFTLLTAIPAGRKRSAHSTSSGSTPR